MKAQTCGVRHSLKAIHSIPPHTENPASPKFCWDLTIKTHSAHLERTSLSLEILFEYFYIQSKRVSTCTTPLVPSLSPVFLATLLLNGPLNIFQLAFLCF